MDLRQVWTLYRHEIRSALRERSIVVMSIVLPLVLYPTLLWAVFAGTSFVGGQAERLTSRVVVQDLPEAHQSLGDSLAADEHVTVSRWTDAPEEACAEIARGRLDALIRFEPAGDGPGELGNNFRAVIAYNEARDRSRGARDRVEAAIDGYRQAWIDEERKELGVPDTVWADFGVIGKDMSTPDESTRFLLGLLVPFLTLVMVAVAGFYPAIDATAGERERSTWETLMTVAAPRGNIATAKYLYVATFAAMGGLLNLAALTLSLQWIVAPLTGAEELGRGGIPLGAFPVIAAGTALVGLFVAAGMLVFAIFARNFKEGQSMITPFYMLIILPVVFIQSPDVELTTGLALVPLVNVALLIREAIMGSISLVPGALTLVSMTVFVVLSVAFAQWIMRREEVLLGAAEGGLGQFLGRRLRIRRRGEP
jgi:sodium transport system permease protein